MNCSVSFTAVVNHTLAAQAGLCVISTDTVTIHLLCPLIGSDDRTGRGGPSPWEQDTAGDDMWPAPEEEDTPVTPDIGEESVSCGTDTGRMTDGQVRAEVKEGPVEKKHVPVGKRREAQLWKRARFWRRILHR